MVMDSKKVVISAEAGSRIIRNRLITLDSICYGNDKNGLVDG